MGRGEVAERQPDGGLRKNDGGSITIMIGPDTPPEGCDVNYVRNIPERGWFSYDRVNGPGAEWFDEGAFALPKI